MPRIYQKAEQYANDDLLREIRSKQGYYDLRTDKALAGACDIPYQTLLRRLQNIDDLTVGELRKLIKVVQLDPEVLLRSVGYASKEIKRINFESA